VLISDEPAPGLDVSVQANIFNLVGDARDQSAWHAWATHLRDDRNDMAHNKGIRLNEQPSEQFFLSESVYWLYAFLLPRGPERASGVLPALCVQRRRRTQPGGEEVVDRSVGPVRAAISWRIAVCLDLADDGDAVDGGWVEAPG
jgi:hypothetical protein